MKSTSKNDTDVVDMLQLISIEDVERQFGEAMASAVKTDGVVTWAKFALTDDKPNENRQRIPIEEFQNIIDTGIHKPIKMAVGEIKDGHEEAKPIGVITNLAIEGNKVMALAALWDHERTDDVSMIKDLVKSNKPVNVSWELFYGNSSVKNGVTDLLDVVLRAVTIVGLPAYAGRTQLLAVAAKKWSKAYIESLPDKHFLYIEKDGTRYFPYRDDKGKIDPSRFPVILEEISNTSLPENTLKTIRHQVTKLHSVISSDASIRELLEVEDNITEDYTLDNILEGKVAELESKLATASGALAAKEAELALAQEEVVTVTQTFKALEEEITPLREFKLEADKVAERDIKLSAIKAKFESLKLEKPEEYFSENADKLLGLDEPGLDFMLQEMVAFKEEGAKGEGEASKKTTSGVPNIPGEGGKMTVSDLAAALRERNKK